MIHENIWKKVILERANTSAKGLEQEHDWHAKKWQGDGSEKEMKNVKYRLRDMEDRQILKNIV